MAQARPLLVSYDLPVATDERRAAVYKILTDSGAWWHYMDSTWLLITQLTPQALVEQMIPHLVQQDRLIIMEVKANYQGWLPEKAWEWINSNVLKFAAP